MKKAINIFMSIIMIIILFSGCDSNNNNDYSDDYITDDTSPILSQGSLDTSNNNGISLIGEETLQYSSKNDSYEYEVYETYVELKKYKGNESVVDIPSEIENLPVKSIGTKCFNYDDPGTYEDTPPLHTPDFSEIKISNTVEVIQGQAFKGVQVSRLVIPDSVKNIGWYAFAYNEKLESITLSSQVVTIEPGTFAGCTSLSSIILPENLLEIGYNAFQKTAIDEFEMPDSVTKCDEGAFSYCSKLNSITLSKSLSVISSKLFKDCANLKEVHVQGIDTSYSVNTEARDSIFSGVNLKNLTIYAPAGSEAAKLANEMDIKFVVE